MTLNMPEDYEQLLNGRKIKRVLFDQNKKNGYKVLINIVELT